MHVASTVTQVRAAVGERRRAGGRIGFVPTMGNLHAGHLALVERAHTAADLVAVSIFVNPLQFAAGEDFGAYPRTLAADRAKLVEAGAHLLFTPDVRTLYPEGFTATTRIEVPGLSDILCGVHRPGHFAGVATVVAMLLNIVQPDVALFGKKDLQQLMVIRRMVRDLHLPVEILGAETVRERDGLAMSSRNGYLDATQRDAAPALYRTLCALRERIQGGGRDYSALERQAGQELESAGFGVDYVAVRRAADLAVPGPADANLVVLAAARLGSARLIDNVSFTVTR